VEHLFNEFLAGFGAAANFTFEHGHFLRFMKATHSTGSGS